MKKGKKPHKAIVNSEMKNFYFQEQYRFCIKKQFEKKYSLLKNSFQNNQFLTILFL